jgi:V8-like Glu-specific endopeptidase
MTLLDTYPFDWTVDAARELRDFLANIYFRQNDAIRIVQATALQPASINWDQSGIGVWHDIIEEASNHDRLHDLVSAIRQDAGAAAARRLEELIGPDPPVDPTRPDRAGGAWRNFDEEGGTERLIVEGSNTLLDVAFLRRGLEISPGIARLKVTMRKKYHGTAFRIGPDLLLTNHHVLHDWDHGDTPAAVVEAWFGYERDFSGAQMAHEAFVADAASIQGDKAHDWAVVKVAGLHDAFPTVSLSRPSPVSVDDRVYIIQHPDGGPKQIGMHHNLVRHVDDDVLQYWTDTKAGSSGSPVFNESWEVVGLHHRWVQLDVDGRVEYRNQAQRIERVVEGLEAGGLL